MNENIINKIASKIKPEMRGVKKGIKRGSYKKKNKIQNEIETEIKTEIKTETNPETETKQTQTVSYAIENNNTSANRIKDDSDLLSGFIEDNKSEGEYTNVTPQIVSNQSNPTQSNQSSEVKKSVSKLINGRMLLNILNVVMPTLIIKLGGIFNKDIKTVKPREIRLNEEQKADMLECSNEIAAEIFNFMSPLQAFVLIMGVSFYSNLTDVLHEKRNEKLKIIDNENED